MDSTNFKYANSETTSVKLIVGVVTGSLAMIAVVALLTGLMIVAKKRKKNYEKIPLLTDQ